MKKLFYMESNKAWFYHLPMIYYPSWVLSFQVSTRAKNGSFFRFVTVSQRRDQGPDLGFGEIRCGMRSRGIWSNWRAIVIPKLASSLCRVNLPSTQTRRKRWLIVAWGEQGVYPLLNPMVGWQVSASLGLILLWEVIKISLSERMLCPIVEGDCQLE